MIQLAIYFFISSIFTTFLFKILLTENNKFLRIYDYPDNRKIHKEKILKIGGIGIIFSSLFVLLLYRFTNGENLFAINQSESLFVISTFFLISGALFDDIIGINAPKKLFFQLIATCTIVSSGFLLEIFNNQLSNYVLTIALFILIINSMNLIDGVDGLSVSLLLVFIIFNSMIYYYVPILSSKYYIIISIFSGAFFTFLVFNFPPANIFLGDTGSQSLGWIFALFVIHTSSSFDYPSQKLYVLSFVSLPFYDVLFVMLKRFHSSNSSFLERMIRVVKPDQNHIHHLLLRCDFSHKDCTLLLTFFYFLCSCISIIPILINKFYLLVFVVVLVLNVLFRIFFEYKSLENN